MMNISCSHDKTVLNEKTGRGLSTSRRALLLAAPAAGLATLASSAARAESNDSLEDTSALSVEELELINGTAAGLEEVDATGGIVLEDGTFQDFDFDALFAALDAGGSEQKAMASAAAPAGPAVAVAMKWNNEHFAKCLAKKIGIADVKEIIKAFAEPKVRKALKSKQWKKASSIAFNILKKTSPKIASFIIKKAANSVLPGGVVGMLALAAGQCALGEI